MTGGHDYGTIQHPNWVAISMSNVAIDWTTVNWLYVVLLALLVFVCAWIGNAISFRRRLLGAVLSTLLFIAGFFFWTYYPHNLPLPNSPITPRAAEVPQAPAPAVPSPSAKPENPVKDVTPPSTNAQ